MFSATLIKFLEQFLIFSILACHSSSPLAFLLEGNFRSHILKLWGGGGGGGGGVNARRLTEFLSSIFAWGITVFLVKKDFVK